MGRYAVLATLLLLLVLGATLRVWDITADLPAYFSGGGQDL
jgi:hypothetical protein